MQLNATPPLIQDLIYYFAHQVEVSNCNFLLWQESLDFY